MDRQFLEFWGNALLMAAKGQQQYEDIVRWMRREQEGPDALTELFRKTYGLDRLPEDNEALRGLWKTALEHFQKTFTDTFGNLGWVPRETHETVLEENNRLRKKIAEKDEMIRQLQAVLDDKGLGNVGTVVVLQELARKQGEAFAELMRGLSPGNEDPTP